MGSLDPTYILGRRNC